MGHSATNARTLAACSMTLSGIGNAAEVEGGVAAADDGLALVGLLRTPPALLRQRKVLYISTDDHSA
jgi:hypothetical protein